MKNYFIFYFFIIFMIDFYPTLGMEQHCIAKTCNGYTQGQVIRRLWRAATNLTPLGTELANLLSGWSKSLIEPNYKLNTIFAQSLWGMDIYSGFQHDTLSVSCVFETILNVTTLDDECKNKEYNQALENYGALVGGKVQYTIRSSLATLSCPTSNSPVPKPRPQECSCGYTVNVFLKKYGSTLPPYMASLIASLNESKNIKDRTMAIVLCALSRGPLNDLFQKILETPELLWVAQLKACDVPITSCCCESREEDLRNRLRAFGPIVMGLLERLLKN